MKDIRFRTLRADEIEVRPAQIKDGKATVLLYIDSRAVVRLLNETVGPLGWQMEFEDVCGQVVGKLGIWDDDKHMWVYKSDTGSESNIEAKKGLYSDCYKRTLARWGVDELYTAPRIIVPDDGYGNHYHVGEISYNDNREITHLVLVNNIGKKVYEWPAAQPQQQQRPVQPPQAHEPTTATNPAIEALREFCRAKIKEEPEWKKDIEKFGIRCAEGIEKKGWRTGKNTLNEWYAKWVQNRKVA